MPDFRGTFLPVTTPFDPVTGDVDVVAFRSNVRQWNEHPVRGILIAGSTGESVFLDAQERVARTEFTTVERTSKAMRSASARNQRYYLRHSSLSELDLTDAQSRQINSALGRKQDPSRFLSPRQRAEAAR